jgi:hypothetical protein
MSSGRAGGEPDKFAPGWVATLLPGRKVLVSPGGKYALYRQDPAPLVLVKETSDKAEAMQWLKRSGEQQVASSDRNLDR